MNSFNQNNGMQNDRMLTDNSADDLGRGANIPKKKRTILQKLKDIVMELIKTFNHLAELAKETKPVSNYIELQPVENKLLIVDEIASNIKKTTESAKSIDKNSFTYNLLVVLLISIFYIFPIVVVVMTIIRLMPLFDIAKIVKTKKFYNDIIIYNEINSIKNIFGYYINDYVLYMSVICLVSLFILSYIFFSNYIIKDDSPDYPEYSKSIFKIIAILSLFIIIIVIFLIVEHKYIQRFGKLRDRLDKLVGDRINEDYISFMEQNNKDSKDLTEVNKLDLLRKYIAGLLIEMKTQAAPSDIALMSVEQFKSYRNDKKVSYYDLIMSAIITYSVILKISLNHFKEIKIDRYFFSRKKSLLLSINCDTNEIMSSNLDNCANNFGKSAYMQSICKNAIKLNDEINACISLIKTASDRYIFPPITVIALCVAFILLLYYLSIAFQRLKFPFMNNQQMPNMQYQPY